MYIAAPSGTPPSALGTPRYRGHLLNLKLILEFSACRIKGNSESLFGTISTKYLWNLNLGWSKSLAPDVDSCIDDDNKLTTVAWRPAGRTGNWQVAMNSWFITSDSNPWSCRWAEEQEHKRFMRETPATIVTCTPKFGINLKRLNLQTL